MPPASIWIGFDPRETSAFVVAKRSIEKNCNLPIPIYGLVLEDLQRRGLYTRPTSRRFGRIYDELSKRDDYDGACATEFAISRFLVPILAKANGQAGGWALFMDCDMLVRANICELFRALQKEQFAKFAVACVKHNHQPDTTVKMDDQVQTRYARKNWSSVAAWNLSHGGTSRLTLEMVNTLPGRDLHAFCWLKDDEIGDIGVEWNWLAGHSDPSVNPKICHHTDGIPSMPGFSNAPYADEWRRHLYDWASGMLSLPG